MFLPFQSLSNDAVADIASVNIQISRDIVKFLETPYKMFMISDYFFKQQKKSDLE